MFSKIFTHSQLDGGQKMKKLAILLSVLFIFSLLFECGGQKTLTSTGTGDIPEWFTNKPKDDNFWFATATAVSRDLQLAIDKATQNARLNLAQQIETQLSGYQKSFAEEVASDSASNYMNMFTQASKSVVDQTLVGSEAEETKFIKEGSNYRSYILMKSPKGAALEELMNSLSKQQELYTRFRASQAFKEMNDEIEKLREYKKSQGM